MSESGRNYSKAVAEAACEAFNSAGIPADEWLKEAQDIAQEGRLDAFVATLKPKTPGIHEFLVNNDLAQYEATLSELGVTHLSHIVDVTAEDLHEFMTPHEAQRFFLSAGGTTPDMASSNMEYMPETLPEGGAYTI